MMVIGLNPSAERERVSDFTKRGRQAVRQVRESERKAPVGSQESYGSASKMVFGLEKIR